MIADEISTNVIVELRQVTTVAVKVTPTGAKRRDRLLAAKCCLGCERELKDEDNVRCGQCDACYQASRARINDGKVTLQQLISNGLMLPPTTGGRRISSSYSKKLAEL